MCASCTSIYGKRIMFFTWLPLGQTLAFATPNVGPTSLADDAAAANLLLLLPIRGAAAFMTLSGDGPELDVDGDATVRGKVPATLAVTRLKLPRADAPLAT